MAELEIMALGIWILIGVLVVDLGLVVGRLSDLLVVAQLEIMAGLAALMEWAVREPMVVVVL
jgi:hypothetical protein